MSHFFVVVVVVAVVVVVVVVVAAALQRRRPRYKDGIQKGRWAFVLILYGLAFGCWLRLLRHLGGGGGCGGGGGGGGGGPGTASSRAISARKSLVANCANCGSSRRRKWGRPGAVALQRRPFDVLGVGGGWEGRRRSVGQYPSRMGISSCFHRNYGVCQTKPISSDPTPSRNPRSSPAGNEPNLAQLVIN